jgi:hypothetical protein
LLDYPGVLILESTTRVLWNTVRVRPTPLVRHPDRGRLLFSVIILAAGRLERAAKVLGKRFESEQPTTSNLLFISVRLCGNDILLGSPFRLLWPEKPLSRKQRTAVAETRSDQVRRPTFCQILDQHCALPPPHTRMWD